MPINIDTKTERHRHVKSYGRSQHCRCMAVWPCPTLELLNEIDRLQAEMEAGIITIPNQAPDGSLFTHRGERFVFDGWASGTLHGRALAYLRPVSTENKSADAELYKKEKIMTADPMAEFMQQHQPSGQRRLKCSCGEWTADPNDPATAMEQFTRHQADAIRAALRDGTLSPEDFGLDACCDRCGHAATIVSTLPKEAPDD